MIRIGAGGHALADAVLGEKLAKGDAAVLAAAVAVKDEAGGDFPTAEGSRKGVDDELGSHVIGEDPTHNFPRRTFYSGEATPLE